MTAARPSPQPAGRLLRRWREQRRLSQLDLSNEAGVSTRHLSFVETGRSQPSREMVLRLAERLNIPLRERNRLLLAAGYAPAYAETALDAPQMTAVRAAVSQVLRGHEPYPAVVVDRRWNLLAANASLTVLTDLVAPRLLEPPANVLRASLHPDGLAPHIVNLGEWRGHLLSRLRHQVELTGDPELTDLVTELSRYGDGPSGAGAERPGPGAIVLPLRLRHDGDELAFFSTVATFGTPLDITLSELSIESFYPADEHTATVLRRRAGHH